MQFSLVIQILHAILQRILHPWRKSYNARFKAIWERDPKYCQKVSLQSMHFHRRIRKKTNKWNVQKIGEISTTVQ